MLVINLNSLEYIYEYLSLNVNCFTVGCDKFSLRQAKTFSYEEIEKLKNTDDHIKVFVFVNALIEQHYLDSLKKHLNKLYDLNIDGILFQDLAVLQIIKDMNWSVEMIYMPDTLNTNHKTLSYLKTRGITGAFLAREISLEDKKKIALNCDIKTMVQIHGVEYMAYSKRKLLSNYKGYTGLDFDTSKEAKLLIQANGTQGKCHIYEDEYGTHVLTNKQLCTLDVLNQFKEFDYLYIDGQFIKDMDLLEITNLYVQALDSIKNNTYNRESIELMHLIYRLTPGVEYYHSFLFDSTVYTITDVRKREENEGNKSNY